MTWHWDGEWLLNLATLALLGVVAGAKAFALFSRNKGRRWDRLVNGLIGWNVYLAVVFTWAALTQLDLLPQHTLIRSVVRIGGVAAGLVTLFALRTAPPLWEPEAMVNLRGEVARLKTEIDRGKPDES